MAVRPGAPLGARYKAVLLDLLITVGPFWLISFPFGEEIGPDIAAIGLVAFIVYRAIFEAKGHTIGKRMAGIAAVDARDGEAGIGHVRATVRSLWTIIPPLLVADIVLSAVTPRRRSVSDMIARTVVVRITEE